MADDSGVNFFVGLRLTASRDRDLSTNVNSHARYTHNPSPPCCRHEFSSSARSGRVSTLFALQSLCVHNANSFLFFVQARTLSRTNSPSPAIDNDILLSMYIYTANTSHSLAFPKVEPGKYTPPIRTQARAATILPNFIGLKFQVYNGKVYHEVTITEDMVGHKLGEFSP